MKLNLACLFAVLEAKKKRGNAVLDDLRFDWQVPKCISTPALCTRSTQLETASGKLSGFIGVLK